MSVRIQWEAKSTRAKETSSAAVGVLGLRGESVLFFARRFLISLCESQKVEVSHLHSCCCSRFFLRDLSRSPLSFFFLYLSLTHAAAVRRVAGFPDGRSSRTIATIVSRWKQQCGSILGFWGWWLLPPTQI